MLLVNGVGVFVARGRLQKRDAHVAAVRRCRDQRLRSPSARRPHTHRVRAHTRARARAHLLADERLRAEGYRGPAGFDALEHAGGLHPLLEVNARYTLGFVALAVEREARPTAPSAPTRVQELARKVRLCRV